MEIFLKEQYRADESEVDIIGSKMIYTKLSDIVVRSDIMYESDQPMSGKEEEEFVVIYNDFADLFDLGNANEGCMSNWVLKGFV